MTAKDYLKARTRICNIGCEECPISDEKNSHGINCDELEATDPDEAVAIVEQWAKTHPQKTYLSELKRLFPKCNAYAIVHEFCPSVLYGGQDDCPRGNPANCDVCWNRPIQERTSEAD